VDAPRAADLEDLLAVALSRLGAHRVLVEDGVVHVGAEDLRERRGSDLANARPTRSCSGSHPSHRAEMERVRRKEKRTWLYK